MKSTDVQAINLRLLEIQQRTDSSQDALLVRVSTDAGVTGCGEVDGCPLVANAVIDAGHSHTQVNGLHAILLGEDPLDTTRLYKMYQSTVYFGRSAAAIQAMAG
jgi:L-rhamnonate dehydratase